VKNINDIISTVFKKKRLSRKPKRSQEEMGREIGISLSTFKRLESGEAEITVRQAYFLAEQYGVKLSTLVKKIEDEVNS